MLRNHKQEVYVGPRPFEFQDKELFFGREQEASELLSLTISHRVMLVYAQSGAGKTSLINARLKPDLEREGFEVLNIVRMQVPLPIVEPEEIDNIFVYKTLLNLIGDETPLEILKRQTLIAHLAERKPEVDKNGFPLPRVIIFDQFEELFNLHVERWEDRKGFFIQVRDAVEQLGSNDFQNIPALWVVFVMREDYIAHLDQYAIELPGKLRTRYRLERLRENAALQAVKGPLKNKYISFDEGVAERLVEELLEIHVETDGGKTRKVKGEYVEPVQLQLVCQSLLESLPSDVTKIREEHVEKFGDVDKTLSRFYNDAVRDTAETTFIKEHDLRDWFENVLITPTGTRGTVYRGRVATVGIPNDAIDILESKHLIRAEYRAGARWYELTHDRFIEPIKTSNKVFRLRNLGQFEFEDESQRALNLFTQGEQARDLKDYDRALDSFITAKNLYEKARDRRSIANALTNIGDLYLSKGEYDLAIGSFEETLNIFKLIDDQWGVIYTLARIARIHEKMGNTSEARELRQQAIAGAAQASENEDDSKRFFERLKREDTAFRDKEQEFREEREKYLGTIAISPLNNVLHPSSVVRAAYSDRMAWLLAVMAKLAYLPFEENKNALADLESKLRSSNFRLIRTFSNKETDTFAFLAKYETYIILAFRGIEIPKRQDMKTETASTRASLIEGMVYRGFISAYRSIEKDLETTVEKLQGLPLYITGHSVGAALATVATQHLERNRTIGNQIAACYTFGSPRIGNNHFDIAFKSPIYRLVNSMDIVTLIPLLAMGYIHIGDTRYLVRQAGKFERYMPLLERNYLFLAAMFRLFGPFAGEHAIDEYVRRLEIIARKRNQSLGVDQ